MGKIRLEGYICERCGYVWRGRGNKKPIVCCNCKSPYWDIPRKTKKKKRRRHKKR